LRRTAGEIAKGSRVAANLYLGGAIHHYLRSTSSSIPVSAADYVRAALLGACGSGKGGGG